MFDIYFDLITKLKDKQSIDSDLERRNIQQDIKRIADRLKKQSEIDGDIFDAAFCYYIAGYYVQSQVLATHAQVDNAHLVQKWIVYFLAKNFDALKVEVSEIKENAKFQDVVIQEEISDGRLSSVEVVEKIITAKIGEGLFNVVSFIETGNDEKYIHAIEIFLSCQNLLCKAGEWRTWWRIECLKLITEEFVENSLWHLLKSMQENAVSVEIVSKYITANYEG